MGEREVVREYCCLLRGFEGLWDRVGLSGSGVGVEGGFGMG